MRGNPSNLTGKGGVGWRAGRDQVTRYLAAKAEAQGQEAREEVLAPADHAGKAPAQPSHVARESGCPGHTGGERRTETPVGNLGTENQRPAPGISRGFGPEKQLGYPAPSSGRSGTADPRRGASLAPSPPSPLGQLQGAFTPGAFLGSSFSPPSAATCQPPASASGFPGARAR